MTDLPFTDTTILSIEAIREGLARDRTLSMAARATGMHYNQIWRIASGKDRNIRYDNLKKLSDYILARNAEIEEYQRSQQAQTEQG